MFDTFKLLLEISASVLNIVVLVYLFKKWRK